MAKFDYRIAIIKNHIQSNIDEESTSTLISYYSMLLNFHTSGKVI